MDRFAVFVDAGYLISGGGSLCCSEHRRPRLKVDFAALADLLVQRGRDLSGVEYLRTYWYDGAKDAVPTGEHLGIARLPGIKLRLGRLTAHGQKGVDSLIVRDLIVLAHERSIATGILIAGDEDLREGLRAAQDLGVRMLLVGIEGTGMSPALMDEADDVVMLSAEVLGPHFSLSVPDTPEITSTEPSGGMQPEVPPPVPQTDTFAHLGREYGRRWIASATSDEAKAVIEARPRIPAGLDAELLTQGRQTVGRSLEEAEKRDMRRGFWDAVQS